MCYIVDGADVGCNSYGCDRGSWFSLCYERCCIVYVMCLGVCGMCEDCWGLVLR